MMHMAYIGSAMQKMNLHKLHCYLSEIFILSTLYKKNKYINMSGPLFHNLNVLQMHFNPLFPYNCLQHINSFS